MIYKIAAKLNSKTLAQLSTHLPIEYDEKAPLHLFSLEDNFEELCEMPRPGLLDDPIVSLVVTNKLQKTRLNQIINSRSVDFLIDINATSSEWGDILNRAYGLYERKRLRLGDLERIKSQNRELESMSQGLEDLVKERTQVDADSKLEVEEKVGQLRDLLRFVQSLSAANTPEEVMQVLRKELKSFHRVTDPILAFALSSGEKRAIYFRSGQIIERQIQNNWPVGIRIRKNESLDSQYLANEFGRPVSKVLAVPLIARKGSSEALHPTLFFEHQLKSFEVERFLDFIGNRLQVVSLALDRLLLELDLRSATYLWEHTFDGLEDPVLIVDTDFGLLRGNRAFQIKRAQYCFDAFASGTQPCEGCPMKSALESGEPSRGMVRRQNTMYTVHSYPIAFSKNERPTTVVNHYLNVTAAMALQEKILQSEKMVALGHLAGHIAHELNNPLTGIRSLAQFWLEQKTENLPEQIRNDLQEVELAAERSQSIITNLLLFATANEQDGVTQVDLRNVVKMTTPLLKTALSVHRFDTEMPDEPILVLAQPQLLQQVLFNLLKNASQAMSETGEIHLKIEDGRGAKANYWCLTVRDSGVGMTDEQQRQIFTPFFTTKAENQGTGLGLSLSQSIVKRFGGDIGVRSEVGQGTTFEIYLPKVSEK